MSWFAAIPLKVLKKYGVAPVMKQFMKTITMDWSSVAVESDGTRVNFYKGEVNE